jgi:branched-chain amino acid transport system substrate-binding protein
MATPIRSAWRQRILRLAGAIASLSLVSAATVQTSVGATTTAGPIVVGGVYASFNFPGVSTGFQARIARFNKSGGIDGRKIKLVSVTDDQDTASTELSAIQQLVQDQHVFAVTPVADDVLGGAVTTFLAQNKTPMIGYGVEQAWCNDKWAISINGCPDSTAGWETTSSIKQIIQASKMPASKLRVAMEGYDIAAAVQVSKTLGEVWAKEGAKVVLNENRVPLTNALSQAPFVQSILASNPNVVFEVTGSASAIALAAALKAAGYKGLIYNGSTYAPTTLSSQPSVAQALDGVYSTSLLPTQYDGTPAVRQELKDLKAVGAAPQVDLGTDVGYWSADLLIQLLEATKARGAALTSANLATTVSRGIRLEPTLAGGNGPLKWPFLSDQPLPCTATVQANGTTYKLSQRFTCYSNVKVATGT